MDNSITKHANIRMSQRGIRMNDLNLLLKYADLVIPARSGCSNFTLGSSGHETAVASGVSIQVADRIRRLSAIVSEDGSIVTVVKADNSRRKRYRKNKQCRRPKSGSNNAYRTMRRAA